MPQGVNVDDAAISIDLRDLGQSQISACTRHHFASLEEITSSSQTAPNKQIGNLCRGYQKVLHGTLGASQIGLPTIRAKYPLRCLDESARSPRFQQLRASRLVYWLPSTAERSC